jgi:hypothetical protein
MALLSLKMTAVGNLYRTSPTTAPRGETRRLPVKWQRSWEEAADARVNTRGLWPGAFVDPDSKLDREAAPEEVIPPPRSAPPMSAGVVG